jgi:hypothetical protein
MEGDLQDITLDIAHRGLRGEAAVDLASARRNAAVFIDNLPVTDVHNTSDRERWVSNWIRTGDGYCLLAELNIEQGAIEGACEAWLCALTAFEVAKRLVEPCHPGRVEINAKIGVCVHQFGLHQGRPAERVRIACCEQPELVAYFLPAGGPEPQAPSIIGITDEDETAEELLGKLLPAASGRGMSLLVVGGADVSAHPLARPEILLECCLDHLSLRPDVDGGRIAVYGERLAAVHATSFAVSDGRVAAAVCDGGLWHSARTRAAIRWMTTPAEIRDEEAASASRMRSARRMRCPVLVIAGAHGVVSVSEAVRLHADCRIAGIDMDVAIPRTVQTPLGAIENFVTVDEFVFGWFERRLAARRPLATIRYL